ncbi:MAG: DUF5320 domain-containing protein [Candidatus Omnitrophica bacterium]|nr:DUF5320 domain-containing protein [Candidatus Omnitrophota bacterium]
MPGFDGTGPFGQGSISGSARGTCAVQMSEGAGTRLGRGIRGLGMGRGHGNCFRALRASGQNGFSQLTELQAKFNCLQADFEALKAKGQQV